VLQSQCATRLPPSQSMIITQNTQRSLSLFSRARVVAVGHSEAHSTLWDRMRLKMRRQAILLRGQFLKKRSISLNRGGSAVGGGWGAGERAAFTKTSEAGASGTANAISPEPIVSIQMSLAEFAGHASFIFSALAFLEQDILNLRLFATSSICFSILFQYYRELPLWLPIKWNFLFVLINITMVGILLKDEHLASSIPVEQKEIYERYFSAEGLPRVEFMRLMGHATRHDFPEEGTDVIIQDARSESVWLLTQGQVQVSRDGEPIALMGPGSFVGEMGFVKWRDARAHMLALIKAAEKKAEKEAQEESDKDWHSGNAEKIIQDTAEKAFTSAENAWNKSMSMSGSSSLFDRSLRPSLKGTRKDIGVREMIPKRPPDDRTLESLDVMSTGVQASAGVTTTTKSCTLYSWKFTDLSALLASEPALALVLERLFSADLQRKIRTNDIKVKYKYVLMGVLVNLEDKTQKLYVPSRSFDTDTPSSKTGKKPKVGQVGREYALKMPDQHIVEFVRGIRRAMRVTPAVHKAVLQELQVPEELFASTDNYDVEVNAADKALMAELTLKLVLQEKR